MDGPESERGFARQLVMRLPDRVRIGPYDFFVEKWDAVSAAENQRYGECSSMAQTIRIQLNFATRWKAVDTFMHELTHAVLWAYGPFGEKDDEELKEETMAGVMGTAMVGFFRDNPWFTKWIEDAQL